MVFEPCCVWMGNLTREPGDKGFSVLAFRDGEIRRLYLQARPFDRAFTSQRDNISALKNVPIAVAMKIPIRYCPHCGAHLDGLIQRQRDAFDAFADSVSELM
ncbi:hypothetical protein ACMHYB_09400 [Sorangium sp. So ce1128]